MSRNNRRMIRDMKRGDSPHLRELQIRAARAFERFEADREYTEAGIERLREAL